MPRVERPAGMAPHELLWFDEDGRGWHVRAEFARVGERMEVVGMEVRSYRRDDEEHLDGFLPTRAEGPTVLSSTIWRALGTLSRDLREAWFGALTESGLIDQPGNERAAAAWRAPKDRVEVRLEEVAAVFVHADQNGGGGTPAVANRFGISYAAAAKRVQRARAANRLPPATRGRKRTRSIEGN